MSTWLQTTLNIKYPIILAPMFLVSDEAMIIAASDAGIIGTLPAHNYRSIAGLQEGLAKIKKNIGNNFGVNLIANKSNLLLAKQLDVCIESKPKFIITSLGNPKQIIEKCKKNNILVLCDVIDYKYAIKVQELGADAIIAVNSGAGGHAGNIPASVLIPSLISKLTIPVISAGGVGDYLGFKSMATLGACGLSVGTPFIATKECPVNKSYKDAIVNSTSDDIILTDRVTGTNCTFIKTNHLLKKINNPLAPISATDNGCKNQVWCAGPSLEFSTKITSVQEVVERIIGTI